MPQDVILVTGCSGRVGTEVVSRFKGFTIVGLDCVYPRYNQEGFHFFHCNLESDESVVQALNLVKQQFGDRIASVIHLAAYYSFAGQHPELYEKITVQGTRRLLLHVKQNFSVEQFLFSSTQLVYKPTPVGTKINEESPLDPKWDYPRSKIKTENLMIKEHGDIPIVILRIAGCYDDECHSIPIANEIQRIYERQLESHLFSGNLQSGAPFLHQQDLGEAIELAFQKRAKLPKELILLIGEGVTLSYNEMQNEISKLLFGKPINTYSIPKWFAKLGAWLQNHIPGVKKSFIKPWMINIADDNYTLDVSKAYQILGWQPRRTVFQTLPLMIQFLKKDPLGFYKTNDLVAPKWLQKKEKCGGCDAE